MVHGYLIAKDNDSQDPNLNMIELKIKSQLRSGYAERFQSLEAHYNARIGVDYFNETIL